MSRERSIDTEQAILLAAWELFCEKGCVASSYTDIAQRSGISRPLVQRYFPSKQLLIDACVVAIRSSAVAVCDTAFPQPLHPLARLYVRGQLSLAAYFANDGVRRFMVDVFASRELTRRVIEDGFLWTVSQTLPEQAGLAAVDEHDEMIMSTGGLYELIYNYLKQGGMPDIAKVARIATIAFAETLNVPLPTRAKSYETFLRRHALAPSEMQKLARKAIRQIPKNLG